MGQEETGQQEANGLRNFRGVVGGGGGDGNVLIFSGGEENMPRFLIIPPGLPQWPFSVVHIIR